MKCDGWVDGARVQEGHALRCVPLLCSNCDHEIILAILSHPRQDRTPPRHVALSFKLDLFSMRECGRLAVCGPCSLLYSSPFLSVTLHEGGTTRAWTIQGRCSSQLPSVGALRRSRATNSLVRRCSCGLGRRLGPVPWRVP